MIHGKSLIGENYASNQNRPFKAFNPASGMALEPEFWSATDEEVNLALEIAMNAQQYNEQFQSVKVIELLEKIAIELEKNSNSIIERAMLETGLPEGRLRGEMGRTTSQIRMFAREVKKGNWLEVSINHAEPDRQPAPKPDLRRMLVPIGPVIVFGASNFPLAFSVAGGDTASALAAGNPVIVKAHPAHPGTSELVGECIKRAVSSAGLHPGTFSLLHDAGFQVGQQLVSHPAAKAVGFTGSFAGGKALFDLAMSRPEPIPFFGEMGSVNPVILLEEVQAINPEHWAASYTASLNLGAGQFCTNPGLLFVFKNKATDNFLQILEQKIIGAAPQVMLTSGIAEHYHRQSQAVLTKIKPFASGISETKLHSHLMVGTTNAATFIEHPDLSEEVFGPFAIVVECNNIEELLAAVGSLKGQLTASLIGTENDLLRNPELISLVKNKVGRLIYNGLPTGVEVNESMQHGGPFPASTDSRFTSVGTAAIKRFARPLALQDCPDSLLPEELRDDNPRLVPQLVDGKFVMPSQE